MYEQEVATDFAVVRAALAAVAEATEYIEAPDGSVAVAAAEEVAAALQHAAASLPESIADWVTAHGSSVDDADVTLAVAAVDRVLGDDSELRELWAEAGEPAWLDGVLELRPRLRPA